MCRLLFVGLLLLAVPALVAAQDDDKGKDKGATEKKDNAKKEAAKDGAVEDEGVLIGLSAWGKIVHAVAAIATPFLLTMIALLMLGLRSDMSRLADLMEKKGPS